LVQIFNVRIASDAQLLFLWFNGFMKLSTDEDFMGPRSYCFEIASKTLHVKLICAWVAVEGNAI